MLLATMFIEKNGKMAEKVNALVFYCACVEASNFGPAKSTKVLLSQWPT